MPIDPLMATSPFVGDTTAQAQNPVTLGYQADGPAAGPLVNQLLDNMQGTQDRNFRASDTANQFNQNVVQQALLDNPNKAAMRALQMSEIGNQQQSYDNGKQKDALNSQLDAEFKKNIASADMSDLTDMHTKAQHYLGMREILDQMGPDTRANWSQMKKAGEQLGIRNIPDQWSPEAEARVRGNAAFAERNLPVLNKLMEINAQGKNAATVANISAGPQYASVAVHQEEVENSMPYLLSNAYRKLGTKDISPGEIQAIHNDVIKYTGQAVSQNPAIQMAGAAAEGAHQAYLEALKKGVTGDKLQAFKDAWQDSEKAYISRVQAVQGTLDKQPSVGTQDITPSLPTPQSGQPAGPRSSGGAIGQPPAPGPQGVSSPTKPAPQKGEVQQGYQYIGGDPSKPQSWQRVQ